MLSLLISEPDKTASIDKEKFMPADDKSIFRAFGHSLDFTRAAVIRRTVCPDMQAIRKAACLPFICLISGYDVVLYKTQITE